ncbi:ANR family transcriptional regulator [Escherichia coli]|nr:ANR family transcriptional regulator [Escherichia coli]
MNLFVKLSLAASNAEKAEQYQNAAEQWNKAALVAQKLDNREWAIKRREFCIMRLKDKYLDINLL